MEEDIQMKKYVRFIVVYDKGYHTTCGSCVLDEDEYDDDIFEQDVGVHRASLLPSTPYQERLMHIVTVCQRVKPAYVYVKESTFPVCNTVYILYQPRGSPKCIPHAEINGTKREYKECFYKPDNVRKTGTELVRDQDNSCQY